MRSSKLLPIQIAGFLICAVMIPDAVTFAGPPAGGEVDRASVVQPVERIPLESASKRWLLLCCGHPGDAEHRERLTEACRKIISAAEPVFEVPATRLRILAGDEEMQQALAADADGIGVCTKEMMKQALEELRGNVTENDSCWVIVLGHAHLHGQRCQFNVLDEDFDQKEFGEWARPISCREQVFLLTFPVSGFWLRPLRASGRVVITATEADLEFTGTEMPYALADVLTGDGVHANLEDIDTDGSMSLLDLYLAVNLEIHGRFKALERLQTEHAQLDDNGDGRGSELQLPYLPVEEEEDSDEDPAPSDETRDKPKIITNPNLDGYRSRYATLKPVKP